MRCWLQVETKVLSYKSSRKHEGNACRKPGQMRPIQTDKINGQRIRNCSSSPLFDSCTRRRAEQYVCFVPLTGRKIVRSERHFEGHQISDSIQEPNPPMTWLQYGSYKSFEREHRQKINNSPMNTTHDENFNTKWTIMLLMPKINRWSFATHPSTPMAISLL
jgi:hypothetical protein